jgi:hypothetical protein
MDILLEVSFMSTYLAIQLVAPMEGHLEQVFHIFGYLKKVPKKRIAITRNRFVKIQGE